MSKTVATQTTQEPKGAGVVNLSLVHNPRELIALVDGRSLIYKIGDLTDWLVAGMMPVVELPNPPEPNDPNDPRSADFTLNPTALPVARWERIGKDDVPRLKAAIDANFKLLNKVMPDLKSVEFTDNTPRRPLNDMELATRLAAVLAATQGEQKVEGAPVLLQAPPPPPAYTQSTYEPLAERQTDPPPPMPDQAEIDEAIKKDEALALAQDELAQMRRAIYAHAQQQQQPLA